MKTAILTTTLALGLAITPPVESQALSANKWNMDGDEQTVTLGVVSVASIVAMKYFAAKRGDSFSIARDFEAFGASKGFFSKKHWVGGSMVLGGITLAALGAQDKRTTHFCQGGSTDLRGIGGTLEPADQTALDNGDFCRNAMDNHSPLNSNRERSSTGGALLMAGGITALLGVVTTFADPLFAAHITPEMSLTPDGDTAFGFKARLNERTDFGLTHTSANDRIDARINFRW